MSAEIRRQALVIGFGSIGKRHARVLTDLGFAVSVVSQHAADCGYPVLRDLRAAIARTEPDYVVLANTTDQHIETLKQVRSVRADVKTLIEKPLAVSNEADALSDSNAVVGYLLRFDPILQRVHQLLVGETLVSAQVYCGQYLPQWRPDRDYKSTYSAQRAGGGGALRDISHELDYCLWLFGPWQSVAAVTGQFSALELDVDDTAGILLRTAKCPFVGVEVNYNDRISQRHITINTQTKTIRADLIARTLRCNDDVEQIPVERDEVFASMHSAFAHDDYRTLCSFDQAKEVQRLIGAIEKASCTATWIAR